MKTHIIPIGNSKGVRIPSALLKLCHIRSVVDIRMKGHTIIIRPIKIKSRNNWMEAFKQMHANKEDQPLIGDSVGIDMENWEW